jgi:hypothetical protein
VLGTAWEPAAMSGAWPIAGPELHSSMSRAPAVPTTEVQAGGPHMSSHSTSHKEGPRLFHRLPQGALECNSSVGIGSRRPPPALLWGFEAWISFHDVIWVSKHCLGARPRLPDSGNSGHARQTRRDALQPQFSFN